eukprot:gene8026-1433_t
MLPGAAPWTCIAVAVSLCAAGVVKGPYQVSHESFKSDAFDPTSHTVQVYYPETDPSDAARFPVISYLHGDAGGGSIDIKPAPCTAETPQAFAQLPSHVYSEMFSALASFGYILVAPEACGVACEHSGSLPHDPPHYKDFYTQQLLGIEWARNQSAQGNPALSKLDAAVGAGICGHSMGGQGTLYACSGAGGNPAAHGIRAAVMQHAYTHSYPSCTVPFLAFTGTKDGTAPPKMAEGFFNAPGACAVRVLVNKVGATHQEPTRLHYNPLMPQWTAAWFKLMLENKTQQYGLDFHSMIYGNSTQDSLCHGGDGPMEACTIYPRL